MTKTYPIELNCSATIGKVCGVWTVLDLWGQLEHVKEVFHVDLSLLDFSEHRAHVKQWARQLHEVSLYHDKITGSH